MEGGLREWHTRLLRHYFVYCVPGLSTVQLKEVNEKT